MPPSCLSGGAHAFVEAVKKSASGYEIVGIRLVRLTARQAEVWWDVRRREEEGGDEGRRGFLEHLEAGEGKCGLVLAVECDNAVTRALKMIEKGWDGTSRDCKAKSFLPASPYSGRNGGRDEGEAWRGEDGGPACFASRDGRMAKEECVLFFGRIFGEDELV